VNKVRPEKVATVKEVQGRVESSTAAVVTEYRGLTVAQLSTLRRRLRTLDAHYKVFKNTLVRRAIAGTSIEPMTEFLEGPTAIAFVDGDISAVAKALRDFTKEAPALVLKGGVLDGKALSSKDLTALADLPGRDVLLSQLAGLLASPMRTMAGLIKALPQNFAYGLSALLEARGGSPVAPEPAPAAEVPVDLEEAAPAASEDAALGAHAAAPDEAADAAPATEAVADDAGTPEDAGAPAE
jgi:large subunit ribosomal protein L10